MRSLRPGRDLARHAHVADSGPHQRRPDDNRLENLRIVCPNCAATLETHCGRKNRLPPRECARCGREFIPRRARHDFCSAYCGVRHDRRRRSPKPETRKVQRPSYEQLTTDLAEMSFVAVGRKYGVSDNAVRKWLRCYQHDAERGPSGNEGEEIRDAA